MYEFQGFMARNNYCVENFNDNNNICTIVLKIGFITRFHKVNTKQTIYKYEDKNGMHQYQSYFGFQLSVSIY